MKERNVRIGGLAALIVGAASFAWGGNNLYQDHLAYEQKGRNKGYFQMVRSSPVGAGIGFLFGGTIVLFNSYVNGRNEGDGKRK